MKLVQTYHTYDGEKLNVGFTTFRSMIKFWNEALAIHLQNYDVEIYTDQAGYDAVVNLLNIDPSKIKVIAFELIDDRYWNIGKFQVHLEQNEPYIMIDVDVKLHDIVTSIPQNTVICEMFRRGHYGLYSGKFGLKNIISGNIPCSGLLGFGDVDFAKSYANKALDKIRNTDLNSVTFEAMWHVEEVFLANEIEDNNKNIITFNDYIHLQGGRK